MTERFGRVAVLLGGNSSEREISLKSGAAVHKALLNSGIDALCVDSAEQSVLSLKEQAVDRVFIMLHGKTGEDGTVQAALACQGLPYTGSRVLASALAMDKVRSKKIWLYDGLATPDFAVLTENSDFAAEFDRLGPVFVKPVNEGSSIGISRANTAHELEQAYRLAAEHDAYVMAERLIAGREFSVSIVGERVLPAIELKAESGFYDYKAKYLSGATRYHCPCDLPAAQLAELEALSLSAYRTLGCEGWGRVDVMQDRVGQFWLLEVNTVPGMTKQSLVPMSAAAAGISFDELVVQILEGTLKEERFKDEAAGVTVHES